jgi:uncharacterized protein YggT (Ycf19 family)
MALTTPTSARRRSPVYRVSRVLTWLVYAFAVAAIAFLGTAFFLRLFNANASVPFVQWVYRATKILMQPFRGIFPVVEGENGSVFDASLLFAMFIYGALAMGMHALLDWIDRKMEAARNAELQAIAMASTRPAVPVPTPPSIDLTGSEPRVSPSQPYGRPADDPQGSYGGGARISPGTGTPP